MIKDEITQYTVKESILAWGKLRLIWLILFVASFVFIARETATARDELIGLGQIHRIICIFLLGIILLRFFIKAPAIPFKSIFFFLTIFSFWQMATSIWSTFTLWTIYRSTEYLIVIWITAYLANSIKNSPILFFHRNFW